MTKKIVQNELNVRGKKFKCWQCEEVFDKAVYWFDSIHAANYKERIINIFCGPKCVQEWYDANDAINFPLRKPPYPKGDEWQIIQQIT